MDTTLFQYCQKIVIFNESGDSILLAKRKGEADFDGVYSFIGGKMETSDTSLTDGLKREKDEEIGSVAKLDVFPYASYNEYYVKKSGQAMVLPHYYAIYRGGKIVLSDEYSDYVWVKVAELTSFEPKISTVPPMVENMLVLRQIVSPAKMVRV